jgi:predicted O-methyltransferase YrrM
MYNFSVDWFSANVTEWKKFLTGYGTPIKALEIGSFEGLSTVWMLENVLTHEDSHITCIDPFTGSDEHTSDQKLNLYERFKRNVIDNFPEKKVTIIREYSDSALAQLGLEGHGGEYDIMYIDGDHNAPQVYRDAMLAWPLLKSDGTGIMIFDDYAWNIFPEPIKCPKMGIDAFLKMYEGEYEILHKGYQVFIRKLKR